jgi:ferredoxin--NADP+ reductase
MTPIGNETNPLRVAIVGAGPSGFYAAGHLLSPKGRADLVVEVDVFDRLPTQWGLVRGGVAPDHPKLKSVSRIFEKTAAGPGFRFFGNVEIGRDLAHEDLAARYHAVVYATGAETDRRLGIPGEELAGSFSATEFVAWYNGHPDYRDRSFDLSCGRAVVVGNGNVAMDVARMLAITTEELERTDMADHAIEVLRGAGIEEIVVLGRRGPAQAAFTNPELIELGEMLDADVLVDPADVELDEHSARSIEGQGDLTARKNVEILTGYSKRRLSGKRRRIILRFFVSPVAIIGDGRVEAVELAHNRIAPDADGVLRAVPTERRERLEAGIVFRSVGYRGVAIPGVPFDERRGTIPNRGGRVVDPDTEATISGVYATGWIKRGPSGVIGTNKKDAHETVDHLLADLDAGALPEPAETAREAIENLLGERRPDHVTHAGWQAIDRAERAAGDPQERPRVKLCSFDELLAAAFDPAAP